MSGTGLTGSLLVSTGREHSCVVRDDGAVQCWGLNFTGQLGNGTTTNSNVPVTVVGIP